MYWGFRISCEYLEKENISNIISSIIFGSSLFLMNNSSRCLCDPKLTVLQVLYPLLNLGTLGTSVLQHIWAELFTVGSRILFQATDTLSAHFWWSCFLDLLRQFHIRNVKPAKWPRAITNCWKHSDFRDMKMKNKIMCLRINETCWLITAVIHTCLRLSFLKLYFQAFLADLWPCFYQQDALTESSNLEVKWRNRLGRSHLFCWHTWLQKKCFWG